MCRILLVVVMLLLSPLLWAQGCVISYAYVIDDAAIQGVHAQEERPVMSVFKMHLAVAVLQKMQREGTSLDSKIEVPQEDWELETWSPLRAKYRGQAVSLSLRELLSSSVSLSDNITTDVLIDYVGGMPALQEAMAGRAVLQVNEAEMTADSENCRRNLVTPASVVDVLRDLRAGKLLNAEYQDFLGDLLIATNTGANKIRALLPQGTIVGNKTGSSGRDAKGLKIADNDAGFIILPDGRTLYLCVFVTDASCSDAACAAHIARIALELYQASTQQ